MTRFSHKDSLGMTDAIAKLHSEGHDAAALLVSDVYRELVELRERDVNQNTADMFRQVLVAIAMMAKPIEQSEVKNYVKFDFAWDEPIEGLPFQRVVVHFMRDGGKSPHELREQAEKERDACVEQIADYLRDRCADAFNDSLDLDSVVHGVRSGAWRTK